MCLSLLALPSAIQSQTVTPVPKLDLYKFTGTWYEIARYPNKRQKHCTSDATILIAKGDKTDHIQIVSSCETKTPYADVKNGTGKAQDKSGDGKLKVSYMWPFTSKYWVLGYGENYSWLLIGSPNHKNLWILSKTPSLKPELLSEIQARATAEGFSLAKLVITRQTAR
ncbi:lipocalin family protein [Terriglobus saanensis]|nr:lipocalin family protein [Terriglobus saanensis]